MRGYRANVEPLKQRNASATGFAHGIARCVEYFRTKVAGTAVTGYQAAAMLERAMIESEPPGTKARERFIQVLLESVKTG